MVPAYTMSATADELEARIRANRVLKLPVEWTDELVFPYYDGLALNNIPRTIAQILGAQGLDGHALDDVLWGEADPYFNTERIIMFISDGLGYLWLKQLIHDDPEVADIVADLTDGRGPLPITSISPSTTAVALPTLWAGVPPASHGMVGTKLFMRELSMLVSLLHYTPQAGRHYPGEIGEWGIDLEQMLPGRLLGEVLHDANIETHLLIIKELARTGLSTVMHRGIQNFHIQRGYTDAWLRMGDVLRETAGKRCYVNVYWPAVDSLSHNYGAQARYLRHEIKTQLTNIRDVLNDPYIRDDNTLFMLIADHGHHEIPGRIYLNEDEDARPIFDAMRGAFGAESRLPYLYLRASQLDVVIETIEKHYADELTYIRPEEALEAGLFGQQKPYHPETLYRLGDLIVIPRHGHALLDHFRRDTSISRHGGLSDWEMIVPLMWKTF